MRPLVLGEKEIGELKSLAAYAERHPLTMDDMLDTMNGQRQPPGLTKEYTRYIPFGFKVVFTIEPNGSNVPVRHLSMSVDAKGKLPNPAAVEGIMKILGFENEMEDCLVRMEDIGKGHQAIEVGEIIGSKRKK